MARGAPMAEEQAAAPGEPSLARNAVGGCGCGCGCLGALFVFLGLILMVAMFFDMVDPGAAKQVTVEAVAAVVSGLLVGLLGAAMYIGSWFLE